MKDTVFVVTNALKLARILYLIEATKKTKLYKVGKKWSRNPV